MGEEKEKPLTREDVLKAIEEHGGEAAGLDLSRKRFEQGIDLRELDLEGIVLVGVHLERARLLGAHLEGARLLGVHLEGAILVGAHLEGAELLGVHLEGAELMDAHLEGADLGGAYLEEADLGGAHLEGAHLIGAKLSHDTRLEDVHWGDYILWEEERDRDFNSAVDSYRRLKQWYTNAGIYDIAGEFFFREMEAKRKGLRWRPQPWHRGWLNIHAFISGHGERPLRVIRWAAIWILGLAAIYYLIGAAWSLPAVWNSLYFSMVSFTALGYGSWVHTTNEWLKGIGVLESFMGVFTIALFLVTFTRKMRR
jgi:hypothetical protein